MTTWEYATVPLLTHATKQILDQWGADGWELVTVLPGPTAWVFTSDHGEEFWEHGEWGHGHALYRELVLVPTFVHADGAPAAALAALMARQPELDRVAVELEGATRAAAVRPLVVRRQRAERDAAAARDALAAHRERFDQRRADHHRLALVALADVEGRGVDHGQQLGPRLLRQLRRLVEPRVLADQQAHAHAAGLKHAGALPRHEVATLVEHLVVGKLALRVRRDDPAVGEQRCRVVAQGHRDRPGPELAGRAILMRMADDDLEPRQGGEPSGAVGQRVGARLHERGPEQQVLRRVAAERELGDDEERRAGRAFARGPVQVEQARSRATEDFATLDADRDGYLSEIERQAAPARMREAMRERRAERRAERGASRPAPARAGVLSPAPRSTPPLRRPSLLHCACHHNGREMTECFMRSRDRARGVTTA